MEERHVTLARVSQEWLNMKKLVVKQSTFAKYYSIIRRHILPELGSLPLEQVNSSTINDFTSHKLGICVQLEENSDGLYGHPMNAKTVRDICTILKSIIKYGESEYHLPDLAGNTVLPKVKHQNKDVLSVRELKKIEAYLWSRQQNCRCAGLLLCLYTGIRLGEICALQWRDIDIHRRIIYINRTIQRVTVTDLQAATRTQIITDEPKSLSSIRFIPIPNKIFPMLQELKKRARREFYFLTNHDGYLEPRTYQYFFKRTLENAQMRRVNFHALRHTFATRCVEVGMDVKTLSELLGHSNVNITLGYYVHSSLESKRRQINMLKL